MATKAVVRRVKTTGKPVGRPSKEESVAKLKQRVLELSAQNALRYIALQQMNRGITRLKKHIDRLRRDAENKEIMYRQVAATSAKIFGAAARGEFQPGKPIKIVGPGAQDFVASLIAQEAERTSRALAGERG